MAIHRQGLVVLGTTASDVVPVENVALSPAVEIMGRRSAGDYYPTLQSVLGASPGITMTMPLGIALTKIGLQTARFGGFKLQILEIDAATGITKSGSSHTIWENASASDYVFACIQSFSCSQGGIATAEVAVWPIAATPGTTHPLKKTESQAALALSAQPTLHTIGPVTVNGTAIQGVASISGTLNHEVLVRKTDGDLYPSYFAWQAANPMLSVAHSDPRAVQTALTLQGANLSSSTKVTFRARGATGLIGATVVSITVGAGFIVPLDIAGGVGSVASEAFEVHPASSDGVTNPWTVGT